MEKIPKTKMDFEKELCNIAQYFNGYLAKCYVKYLLTTTILLKISELWISAKRGTDDIDAYSNEKIR